MIVVVSLIVVVEIFFCSGNDIHCNSGCNNKTSNMSIELTITMNNTY